jgi:head-tail adaptor
MKISRLDKKVTLYDQQFTPDGAGGFNSVPVKICDLWANITRHKVVNAEKDIPNKKITHKIIVRNILNLTESMSIGDNGVFYYFDTIRTADKLGKYMEIYSIERQS